MNEPITLPSAEEARKMTKEALEKNKAAEIERMKEKILICIGAGQTTCPIYKNDAIPLRLNSMDELIQAMPNDYRITPAAGKQKDEYPELICTISWGF